MCMYSAIGDQFGQDFFKRHPVQPFVIPSAITREEFDALKKEVDALRELLVAAKKYDKEVGHPDCEQPDKVALLKQIAKLVGVDLSDVIGA